MSKETYLQIEHLTFLSENIKNEQLSIDLDEKLINSLVNYNEKTSLIIGQARERIKKAKKNQEILSQIIIVIMFNK